MKTLIRNPRLLVFLVFFLLISNVGVLIYFTVFKNESRSNTKSGDGVVEHIKKKLELTDTQTEAYKKLLDEFRDSMKTNGEELRRSKLGFYTLISKPQLEDSLFQQAGKQLSAAQSKMDLLMFRHFQQVRAICNEKQQLKYDSMVVNMMSRGSRFNRPKTENK
jgi:uncharacterized protein YdiU (UPF0061 family)